MFVPAMVRVESAPLPVFLCRIHVDYCFCGLLEPNFLYDFFCKNACVVLEKSLPLHPKSTNDSVAQLVEQMTLNHWVESSSLSGVTGNQAVN